MQTIDYQMHRCSVELRSREMSNQGERGAAIVEYVFLMGAVAVMLMGALQVVGQHVSSDFDDILAIGQEAPEDEDEDETVDIEGQPVAITGAAPAASGSGDFDEAAGTCPNGWSLISNTETKKNGQDVDANNDGLICLKQIPGKGKGNTNQNANIKDNNGG